MTDELDAIRVRDGEWSGTLFSVREPTDIFVTQEVLAALSDRRALLAEIAKRDAALLRLGDLLHNMEATLVYERARLRERVEALPTQSTGWQSDVVYRSAVLAAIDGQGDGVYIGPIEHSDAQCWTENDATCHCWCRVCERHNRGKP